MLNLLYGYLHYKIATVETTDYNFDAIGKETPWHMVSSHSQMSFLVPEVFGNQPIFACYSWGFVIPISGIGAYFVFEFFIDR